MIIARFACFILENWKSCLSLSEIINLAPGWHPGMSQHLKVGTFIQSYVPFQAAMCYYFRKKSVSVRMKNVWVQFFQEMCLLLLSITIYCSVVWWRLRYQKDNVILHIVTGSQSSSKWTERKASDCSSFLGTHLHKTIERHGTNTEKQIDHSLTATRLRSQNSRRQTEKHRTFKLRDENNRRTHRVRVCHRS